MKVSNYDEDDYNYKTYWSGRNYENEAERYFLRKVFSKLKGFWFIDIGGSFGRLTDLYSKNYKHSVIIDYSLKTLQENRKSILETNDEFYLVAANAYFLPFKDSSFDGGAMVRVLHHINEPTKYFNEAHRVLSNNSTYIQEFANKMHIKAIIKNLLKGNLKFFSTKPYQQPNKGYFEGTKGTSTTFLNFHPKDISKMMTSSEFHITAKQGISFLRVPFLKKIASEKTLFAIEKFLQSIFRGIYIAPSIFYTSTVTKKGKTAIVKSFESLLCCPKCKGDLKMGSASAVCKQCDKVYLKKKEVWDFRINDET